jgi:hypothetical protein
MLKVKQLELFQVNTATIIVLETPQAEKYWDGKTFSPTRWEAKVYRTSSFAKIAMHHLQHNPEFRRQRRHHLSLQYWSKRMFLMP